VTGHPWQLTLTKCLPPMLHSTKNKPSGSRNPLKAVVPELLFMARVAEMLQGLGAKLGARVEYLEIMAQYCRKALIEDARRQALEMSPLVPIPAKALTPSFLDRKIRSLINQLRHSGEARGAQVVVIKNGHQLVDLAMGPRGTLEQDDVTPSTLFCGYSISKMVLAVLVHRLVDDGVLTYDTPIAAFWPDFATSPVKASITVRHVLGHTAGLQYAFPPKATVQMLTRKDAEIEKCLLEADPITAPGSKAAFHYFTYGWLLQAVLERSTGKSVSALVRELIGVPLGMEDDLMLAADMTTVPRGRLAVTEYSLRDMVGQHLDNTSGMSGASLAGLMGLDAADPSDVDSKALELLLKERLAGREFLLDHRLLNSRRLLTQEGGLPSLNGRFTAKGLAALMVALAEPERSPAIPSPAIPRPQSQIWANSPEGPRVPDAAGATRVTTAAGPATGPSPPAILSAARLRDMRCAQDVESPAFTRLVGRENAIRLGLGVQLFSFRQTREDGTEFLRSGAYGHASAGGQLVLVDPFLGLVIAVLGNRAPLPGDKNLGFEVLKAVAEELNLGVPVPIW
jgi:CubicO group peptidase (beta-lactamase class C family)